MPWVISPRYPYVNSLLGGMAIEFTSSKDNSDGGNASEGSLVLLSSILWLSIIMLIESEVCVTSNRPTVQNLEIYTS